MRDVRIETRHQIVNAPDRAFDLSLNGVETCAGVGGMDKRLKRDRGLLLNLLERGEIASRRVELVGSPSLLGAAPCQKTG